MVSKIFSSVFVQAVEHVIEIEIYMSGGIPQINMVGLPDQAVKESKERLVVALTQQGMALPNKRFTINFNPPDLKKQGGHLDLPIAIGLMMASGKIQTSLQLGAMGAVNLLGEVHDFPMAFALIDALTKMKPDVIIIPIELAYLKISHQSQCIIAVKTLDDVRRLLKNKNLEELVQISQLQTTQSIEAYEMVKKTTNEKSKCEVSEDFEEVKNQEIAKLALIYAVSGNHHLLMYGPPGTGKTMLARRLPTIQPNLNQTQKTEMNKRLSISNGNHHIHCETMQEPFRAPHHGSSQSAILGGMRANMVGEAALAHYGILFMDELPEFKRDVIEGLRGPIESGELNLSKALYKSTIQARFTLIATANPCPCGYHGFSSKCVCNARDIERYFAKISGPILDRFDMSLQVSYRENQSEMVSSNNHSNMNSSEMFKHVERIRGIQKKRFGDELKRNGQLNLKEVKAFCLMTEEANAWFLEHVCPENHQHSYRRQYKILKLSRTIADFNDSELIEKRHIIEAFYYNKRQINE